MLPAEGSAVTSSKGRGTVPGRCRKKLSLPDLLSLLPGRRQSKDFATFLLSTEDWAEIVEVIRQECVFNGADADALMLRLRDRGCLRLASSPDTFIIPGDGELSSYVDEPHVRKVLKEVFDLGGGRQQRTVSAQDVIQKLSTLSWQVNEPKGNRIDPPLPLPPFEALLLDFCGNVYQAKVASSCVEDREQLCKEHFAAALERLGEDRDRFAACIPRAVSAASKRQRRARKAFRPHTDAGVCMPAIVACNATPQSSSARGCLPGPRHLPPYAGNAMNLLLEPPAVPLGSVAGSTTDTLRVEEHRTPAPPIGCWWPAATLGTVTSMTADVTRHGGVARHGPSELVSHAQTFQCLWPYWGGAYVLIVNATGGQPPSSGSDSSAPQYANFAAHAQSVPSGQWTVTNTPPPIVRSTPSASVGIDFARPVDNVTANNDYGNSRLPMSVISESDHNETVSQWLADNSYGRPPLSDDEAPGPASSVDPDATEKDGGDPLDGGYAARGMDRAAFEVGDVAALNIGMDAFELKPPVSSFETSSEYGCASADAPSGRGSPSWAYGPREVDSADDAGSWPEVSSLAGLNYGVNLHVPATPGYRKRKRSNADAVTERPNKLARHGPLSLDLSGGVDPIFDLGLLGVDGPTVEGQFVDHEVYIN